MTRSDLARADRATTARAALAASAAPSVRSRILLAAALAAAGLLAGCSSDPSVPPLPDVTAGGDASSSPGATTGEADPTDPAAPSASKGAATAKVGPKAPEATPSPVQGVTLAPSLAARAKDLAESAGAPSLVVQVTTDKVRVGDQARTIPVGQTLRLIVVSDVGGTVDARGLANAVKVQPRGVASMDLVPARAGSYPVRLDGRVLLTLQAK
ncbi:MAG: hypothetical protein U0Q15_14245 [Kineosporiaceae bacterium]